MKLFRFEMNSEVLVNEEPGRVWSILADVGSWPSWTDICTEVRQAPAHLQAGSQFRFRLKFAAINVPFHVKVVDAEPGRRLSWSSTEFSITALRTHTLRFLPPSQTLIVDSKSFSSPLLPIGICYPRWLITRMSARWLSDLKARAEMS